MLVLKTVLKVFKRSPSNIYEDHFQINTLSLHVHIATIGNYNPFSYILFYKKLEQHCD